MTCDGPVCGRGVSPSTSGGGAGALVAHECWRPDWRPDRSCLARAEAEHLIEQMPRTASTVTVDRLTLASVRRRAHHYEWDVVAETDLSSRSDIQGTYR